MGGLAIFGASIAIYQTWFYEAKPFITFSVVSNANIFDIHTPIDGLEISYNGQDFRNTNKELRLLIIRVANTGTKNIIKSDFDTDSPLGFKLSNGHILDTPHITSTDPYLREHVHLAVESDGQVKISPFLFDHGRQFDVQLLISIEHGTIPNISTHGKISGIKELEVSSEQTETGQVSLWKRAVGGDTLWIHPIRMIIYTIGLLITILLVGLAIFLIFSPWMWLDEMITKDKRRKLVLPYSRSRTMNAADQLITSEYIESGPVFLKHLPFEFQQINRKNFLVKGIKEHLHPSLVNQILKRMYLTHSWFDSPKFNNHPLISRIDNELIIDNDIIRAAQDFIDYCKTAPSFKGDLPTTLELDEADIWGGQIIKRSIQDLSQQTQITLPTKY
jgi:hypothetical protein